MPRKNDPSEAYVQRKIIEYLESIGGFVLKITANRSQQAGIPDLYCALPGNVQLWIEVKKPVNSYGVTPLQTKMHRDMRQRGVPVFVCASVDEVKACLKSFGLEV